MKRKINRLTAFVLSAIMLFTSVPVYAIEGSELEVDTEADQPEIECTGNVYGEGGTKAGEYAEVTFKDRFTSQYVDYWVDLFSVKATASGKIAKPVSPIKPKTVESIDGVEKDYIFVGWCTDEELTNLFDFENDSVVSDISLYAKWQALDDLTGDKVRIEYHLMMYDASGEAWTEYPSYAACPYHVEEQVVYRDYEPNTTINLADVNPADLFDMSHCTLISPTWYYSWWGNVNTVNSRGNVINTVNTYDSLHYAYGRRGDDIITIDEYHKDGSGVIDQIGNGKVKLYAEAQIDLVTLTYDFVNPDYGYSREDIAYVNQGISSVSYKMIYNQEFIESNITNLNDELFYTDATCNHDEHKSSDYEWYKNGFHMWQNFNVQLPYSMFIHIPGYEDVVHGGAGNFTLGWYSTDTEKNSQFKNHRLTEDITVIPTDFTKRKYSVSLATMDNGWAADTILDVGPDEPFPTYPLPDPKYIPEGKKFAGWWKVTKTKIDEWNYTVASYDTEVTPTTPIISTLEEKDYCHPTITLYAKWVDDDGGSDPKPDDPKPAKETTPTIGGEGATDPQPSVDKNTTSLTLIKGQKFVLADKDWKSNKKAVVSVSKGAVTAKAAGTATLSRGSQSIAVKVVAPAIAKKDKTLKLVAGNSGKLNIGGIDDLDLPVLYTSNSPDIASVDAEGNVIAVSKGNSLITAYINGVAFKFTAKVADADTSKRDFTSEDGVSLVPNQTIAIKATGFKASKAAWTSNTKVDTDEKNIVYRDNVVKIDKSGKMTAIGVGNTKFTGTDNKSNTVNIKVNVSAPMEHVLHLNMNTSKSLKIYGVKGNLNWEEEVGGEVVDPEPLMAATGNGSGITEFGDKTVKYQSGKFTGLKTGVVTLKANDGNFDHTLKIYVEDPSVTGLEGKAYNYSVSMKVGEEKTFTLPGVMQDVTFISNKASVAFASPADTDGVPAYVISARGDGSAKLSTKINGKAVKISVKVTK